MIDTNYSKLLEKEANFIKQIVSDNAQVPGEFRIENPRDNENVFLVREVRNKKGRVTNHEVIAQFTVLGVKIRNKRYTKIIKQAIKDINLSLFDN